MRAMVLAAGYGKRMRPLTENLPKALIPIRGMPLLAIVLKRLDRFGFTDIAVNAHYRGQQIGEFLHSFSKSFRCNLYTSYEPVCLDTGGGIKQMLEVLPGNGQVLVHNVDILSNLNLRHLMNRHQEEQNTATLVVNSRKTDRPLLFDENNLLIGRGNSLTTQNGLNTYGFCGIQVIQPELFETVETDIFYSIDIYLSAARQGQKISASLIDGTYWRDIGTPQDLQEAIRDLDSGRFQI